MTAGFPPRALDAAPMFLAAAVAAGARFGEYRGPASARAVLAVVLVLAVMAAATPGRLRVLLIVLALALGASASMQRALDGLERSPLTPLVAERVEVELRGTLVSDPTAGRFSTHTRLRVDSFRERPGAGDRPGGWRDGGNRQVLATAGAPAGGELALLSAGDRVEVLGWLAPLSGWDERERWQHAAARLDVTELLDFHDPSDPLVGFANRLRETVLHGLEGLPVKERGLVAAVLVGDTRDLPASTLADFRAAGLSHLLVVSGSNVAFVLALAGPLLHRLGLNGRLLAGAAVVLVFAAMTRFEPSVVRASVMAGLAMVASTLGRPAAPTRTLGLTVAGLILVDPFLIHSVAFLLSCAATAGIVVLAPALARRLPGPASVRTAVAVTLAAQIGVAPVLLFVFGSVPLASVPANLVAAPVAAPLTSWGLAAALAGGLLDSAGALVALLQLPTAVLARAVLTVADLGARLPFAMGRRSALGGIALTAAVAAVLRIRPVTPDRRIPVANLRRDGHSPAR